MAGNWLNCRSHAAGRVISFGGVQFAARLPRRAPHFHCGRRQVETLIEPRSLGTHLKNQIRRSTEIVAQRGSWEWTWRRYRNFYRRGDSGGQHHMHISAVSLLRWSIGESLGTTDPGLVVPWRTGSQRPPPLGSHRQRKQRERDPLLVLRMSSIAISADNGPPAGKDAGKGEGSARIDR